MKQIFGYMPLRAYIIIIIFLMASADLTGRQLKTIKGRVIDYETEEPLPYASVFLNNSTFGASTNDDGTFEFLAPPGNYDLIVNFFSYKPIIYQLSITEEPLKPFLFKLSPLEYDLQEVSVESTRDEVWYRNYNTFKYYFLGSSRNARNCEILNPEVLIIDYNAQTKKMIVRARDALKIVNKSLGYEISYLLDSYLHDLKENYVFYQGYPSFKEMTGGKSKFKKWEKERKRAYFGSTTHFFASLMSETVEDEGYSLIEIVRKPNPNRPSEDEISAARKKIRYAAANGVSLKADSPEMQVMSQASQSKMVQYTNNQRVDPATLLRKDDDQTKLDFGNYIQIRYKNEDAEPNFTGKATRTSFQETTISLTNGSTVISSTGLINPSAILFEGYMGWEKLGDLLPLDYKLPKGK